MEDTSEIILEIAIETFFGLKGTTIVKNEEARIGTLIDLLSPLMLHMNRNINRYDHHCHYHH